MAESEQEKSPLQVRLPPEMATMLDQIKVVRAANFEPLTNTAIVIDAVKAYYKNVIND